MPTPDLLGFRDAQRKLRREFAETITFLEPEVAAYPPGTQMDPETGKPYDPVIEADSTTQITREVRCNVVFKAINRAGVGGEAETSALGWNEATAVMLICDIDDKPNIDDAEEFILRDEIYKITATKDDGIGSTQRVLVYGRKR